MNHESRSSSPLRRVTGFAAAALAAGGLVWAAAAFAANDPSPQVAVKVDEKPLERSAVLEPSSLFPGGRSASRLPLSRSR